MVSISVIVPVYNKREYLKRSIDSILAQEMPGMEVVLVDDVSTDGSFELCQELYGGRNDVRILRQARKGGAGPARNAGLQAAQGRFVAFVDADDVIHPGYLQRLYKAAVLYRADVVGECGDAFESPEFFPASFSERSSFILKGRYKTTACYKLYRTSFLRKHGIVFYPMTFFEDVLFGLKTFLYAQRGIFLPGLHYEVILTPDSITRGDLLPKCPAYIDSLLRAFHYLENDLAGLPEAQERPAVCNLLFAFLMALSLRNHFGKVAKKHTREEIHEEIEPVLQQAFGENALFVQILLDWCIALGEKKWT